MTLIRRYLPFVKASFSVSLAYRMHIVLWIFSGILEIVMMLFLWGAVYRYSNVDSLFGFGFTDIVFYNVFMTLSSTMVYMNPLWDVTDDFVDGKIAMHVIKPISYTKMIFALNLGGNLFRNVMVSLPILGVLGISYVLGYANISITLSQWGIFLVSIALGLWINFHFNLSFSALVFKTEATFGLWQLNDIVLRIFSGALIPLAFFPGTIQNILLKLPFAAIQSTPTLILLGRLNGDALIEALSYQVFWAIVLTLISSYIWHRTLNNLKVNGG